VLLVRLCLEEGHIRKQSTWPRQAKIGNLPGAGRRVRLTFGPSDSSRRNPGRKPHLGYRYGTEVRTEGILRFMVSPLPLHDRNFRCESGFLFWTSAICTVIHPHTSVRGQIVRRKAEMWFALALR
jgi:hypothetical protein